jgi:hypothetical protein
MTALNDPGTPDDQNEDLFDQTPLPQPGKTIYNHRPLVAEIRVANVGISFNGDSSIITRNVPFLSGPDEPSDDDWGDSDDEEEQGGADGYQLLPQDAPQIRNQEMQGEQGVLNWHYVFFPNKNCADETFPNVTLPARTFPNYTYRFDV